MEQNTALQNLLLDEYGPESTEQEAAESARTLVGLMELFLEIDQRNKRQKNGSNGSKNNKSKAK